MIGFGPLFILLQNSKLKNRNLIFKWNLLSIFLVLLSPVLLLFAMMYDWGRIVNISYTIAFLSFIYLLKNELIIINFKKLSKGKLNQVSKSSFYFIFIIFSFSWSPKTVVSSDIVSFPIYRIPYKLIKIIFLN